jgi:glycosyltransferase involved in cell wall biosynthesis
MRLSIGIFAHNEEGRIGRLIESLTGQDLIKSPAGTGNRIEIITLANGCRDRTAQEANDGYRTLRESNSSILARTEIIEASGKSNAWNMYVHRFSDPLADFLICMDADITLVGAGTLSALISALILNPKARISVDVILKDITLKRRRTFTERISIAATNLNQSGPVKLAGSLYCGRAAILRRVWMPTGLLVEDGFLKAMVATDNLTQPEDPEAIIQSRHAAHTFEAVTNLRVLFHHETRLLIGTWMNVILFSHLRDVVTKTGETAGMLIQAWNAKKPEWFSSLLRNGSTHHGFLSFAWTTISLPLRQAYSLHWTLCIIRLPIALLRCAFTGAALLSVSGRIRKNIYRW